MRQEVIESVLESFEDQPSNLTMIQEYERMAKTHLNNYLEALLENKAKKLPEDQGNLLMGIVNKTVKRVGIWKVAHFFFTDVLFSVKHQRVTHFMFIGTVPLLTKFKG